MGEIYVTCQICGKENLRYMNYIDIIDHKRPDSQRTFACNRCLSIIYHTIEKLTRKK